MNIQSPIAAAEMQVWFTALEFAKAAEAGLFTGLPETKRGMAYRIETEGWRRHKALARERSGSEGGGGFEYHIDQLQLHERLAYISRFILVEPADLRFTPVESDNLTGRARLSRDAKLAVLRVAKRFVLTSGLTIVGADGLFVQAYNAGNVDMPEWVRTLVGRLSMRTLSRWRSAAAETGGEALAHDPSLARKGSGLLETAANGRVKSFILAWVAANPHLSAKIIRGYVEDEFGAELVDRNGELQPLPAPRTFQLFLKTLKADEKVVLTKITDPDRYRSTMKLSGTGAYRHVTEPNGLWMIDASPVDALCLDGRHSLYACIDIATRRLVITLSKTPRASAVGLMTRKAILKWGVARIVKTDNGSDFVAIETTRLFDSLDIEVDVSDAYSPEQKGHVERVIKTFQHEVCPQLPGYIGHSVADRKAIEGRKSFAARMGQSETETFSVSLTAEQLQHHIDDWLDHEYHHRAHGGLKNGLTPQQAADASRETIRRVDERALDLLLMPVARRNGICRMTKQGIKLNHFHYLNGSILVGSDVFVRRDPLDMGKIYLFSVADGRYLDVALCAELSDVNPAAFVRAQKQVQAELIEPRFRQIKADLRELKRGPSGIERTIRLAKNKSAEREAAAANVVPLPKREETHSTPQIAAALDAMSASKAPVAAKLSAAAAEMHAAIERELAPQPTSAPAGATPLRKEETERQRFLRFLDIERRHEAGEELPAEMLIAFGAYQTSAEWKAHRIMMDAFGDDAPVMRG